MRCFLQSRWFTTTILCYSTTLHPKNSRQLNTYQNTYLEKGISGFRLRKCAFFVHCSSFTTFIISSSYLRHQIVFLNPYNASSISTLHHTSYPPSLLPFTSSPSYSLHPSHHPSDLPAYYSLSIHRVLEIITHHCDLSLVTAHFPYLCKLYLLLANFHCPCGLFKRLQQHLLWSPKTADNSVFPSHYQRHLRLLVWIDAQIY